MGIIRRALLISTGGLAGLVLPEASPPRARARPSKPQRARKAAAAKPRASAQPKPQTASRTTKTKAKPKRQATRPVPSMAASVRDEGTAYELERVATLHRDGALTVIEFAAAKAKILGTDIRPPEEKATPPEFPAVEASITAARQIADLASDPGASLGNSF